MHEVRNHWTLVKQSDFLRKNLDKNGKLKTILSIWSFKSKWFPSVELMKHKSSICAHCDMQQWGMEYWETYIPVFD